MERSPRPRAIASLLTIASVVFAACVAAVLSHVGIDAIGDVVLSRDAYDDIAHGSRSLADACAASLLLACIVSALWIAVVDGRGGRARVRTTFALVAHSPWRFVTAVVFSSLGILLAMEALDTLAQNGRIDDLSDLFGGSIALGLSIAVPSAVAVAQLVRLLIGTLLRSCHALVAAVGSFVRRALQRVLAGDGQTSGGASAGAAHQPCVMSLKASRRGPPTSSTRRFITA